MKGVLFLAIALAGCGEAGAAHLTGAHRITQQVAAVISPYSIVSAIAGPYTYCIEYPIPPGVTSVEVGVHNRNIKDAVNGAAYTMTGLAVGTGNATGNGWDATPNRTTWTSIAVPNTGEIVWNGPANVTRSAQGTILIAWQFPSGADVAYESGGGAALPSGYVNASGTSVNTLASMTAVNGTSTLIGGGIVLRYNVTSTQYAVVSDSIHRGIQYAGLANTDATMVGARGYSVAVNGVASSTAAMWASPSFWPWSHYKWRGNVFVALGTNDVAAGTSAATIQTDITSAITNARANGARKVGVSTIPPSSVYSGAQNTVRNTVNAALMSNCCGADFTVDADTLTQSAPNTLDPLCGAGPVHLNATCLQRIVTAVPSL